MRKVLSGLALLASLCLFGTVARAQDAEAGEKTYKTKCAGCHGQNSEGKPAMKAPPIKGKTADDIQKQITTSPKHKGVKNLTPAEVNGLAAYLATLK